MCVMELLLYTYGMLSGLIEYTIFTIWSISKESFEGSMHVTTNSPLGFADGKDN